VSHLCFVLALFASSISAAPPLPLAPAADHGSASAVAVPALRTVPADPRQRLVDLPFGELLVYRGQVEKAGMTFDVGRATLRALRDDDGQPTLEARAQGAKFGYELNTRIATTLDEVSLLPAIHEVAERGTQRRTKKLIFDEGGAEFLRFKHCRDENCGNPAHFVKRAKMHGPIPWGAEHVHCDDRNCRHREHYEWRSRLRHEFPSPYFDLLSAIYLARQVEFSPSAEPLVIPIVNDTRRWDVRVRARSEKRIEVAAGTFDAVELVLEPVPASGVEEEEDAEFRGLFGLNGAIQIWIDRASRRPILIEGTLPFAFLELHAKVELEKVEIEKVETATIETEKVETAAE